MSPKDEVVIIHPWKGFCPDCDGDAVPGTICPVASADQGLEAGPVESRFERHGGGPMPYQTPPPPSRQRRFKKPKKIRP